MQNNTPSKLITVDHEPSALAEILEKTKWADEFSHQQITKMVQHMKAIKASPGTIIFREGTADNSMGIIIKGHINIAKNDHDHHNQVIAQLGPDNTFGEMSLIDGEPRSALAIAADEVELLMLSKDDFLTLCNQTPGLGIKLLWKMARMISQRLRKTSGKLIEHLGEEN